MLSMRVGIPSKAKPDKTVFLFLYGISQSWYFPGLTILATQLDLFLTWVHTGLVGCILVSHENIFHTRKQYHLTFQEFIQIGLPCTAWKVSQYGVFSGLYFPAFGLNTERFSLSLRIQSECGKIRTRKKSVFGHFSRSVNKNWLLDEARRESERLPKKHLPVQSYQCKTLD